MGQRHWLDPLARRLLIATGQLPAPPRQRPSAPAPSTFAAGFGAPPGSPEHDEAVESDLLALKLSQSSALRLESAADVRRAAELGWRLDVNRATAADWLRLPGCTAGQVDLLLRLQAGGVQLSGPEDLRDLLDLPQEVLHSWLPVLAFRWYGEPPPASPAPRRIDVNLAPARQLNESLGLPPERCRRLLGERARAPFRDLADLQERLQLPASLVESWIGRVSFRTGTAGPVLPPARRTRR